MKELNEKLIKIQTEFKSKKSSYNSFGKYYFRKAEDILEAVKPFLKKLDVSITINEKLVSYTPPILETTASLFDGVDAIHAIAVVGIDLNQKGMQTAQQFGAASSYGKKYALGNLLLIDDTQDADSGNKQSKTIDKIKSAAKPNITAGQLDKAKEYIKAGGDIEAIKTKYKLTEIQEKELNGQKANTTKA